MRQPHETQKAFRAFSFYRDLGAERSIDKAYIAFWVKEHQPDTKTTPQTQPKEASRHWNTWSVTYHWVERAAAYDADINQRAQQAFENELISRRQQTLRDEYDAATAQLELWQKEYESAKTTSFDLKELNLLGRLRTILNAQRRLALGMPTTATDVTSAGEKLAANVLAVDDLAEVFKQIQQHKEGANHAGS